MDCPKCNIPMEKDHTKKIIKDQLAYFTGWFCEGCGHQKFSLYDVKIKNSLIKSKKNDYQKRKKPKNPL